MGFLSANFQLAMLFHYGTDRRTDGQTTAINALCSTLWGGHNIPS